jgi:integrase/recombinase XerD
VVRFPEVRRVAAGGDGGDVYVVGLGWWMTCCGSLAVGAWPNTVRAYAHDLTTFFTVVAKDPVEVRANAVFAFIIARKRRSPARRTWHGSPVAARACRRRRCVDDWPRCRRSTAIWPPAVMSGWTTTGCRGVFRHVGVDAVTGAGCRWCAALAAHLGTSQVTALLDALRTERDRAMVQAMVLSGLRRCEVLGLRLEDVRLACGGC